MTADPIPYFSESVLCSFCFAFAIPVKWIPISVGLEERRGPVFELPFELDLKGLVMVLVVSFESLSECLCIYI